MAPCEGVSGMSLGEKTSGTTLDMLKTLCFSTDLGLPWGPPRCISGSSGKEDGPGFLAKAAFPLDSNLGERKTMRMTINC